MRQHREALPNGIRRGSLGAKSIGVRIALRFRNRIETQQVQSLHGSIMHRGNRQGTQATRATVFRNVDAPKRLGAVAPLPQVCHGACFLLRRVPDDSIDTRRPFTLVARHSLDSNRFAAERVGQQMLQGSHLTPRPACDMPFLPARPSQYVLGASAPCDAPYTS